MNDKEAKKIITERNKLKKEYKRLHKIFLKTKFSSPDFELIRSKVKAAELAIDAQYDEFRAAFAYLLTAPISEKTITK